MAGYAAWTIRDLKREKTDIDTQIRQIEAQLQSGTLDSKRIDQLVGEITEHALYLYAECTKPRCPYRKPGGHD